jgi:hypothetical protein
VGLVVSRRQVDMTDDQFRFFKLIRKLVRKILKGYMKKEMIASQEDLEKLASKLAYKVGAVTCLRIVRGRELRGNNPEDDSVTHFLIGRQILQKEKGNVKMEDDTPEKIKKYIKGYFAKHKFYKSSTAGSGSK